MDFGTSNSAVACVRASRPALAPVDGDRKTVPSSVFFDFEEGTVLFGRKALQAYIDGCEGRLMRALKSVLGSPLLDETIRTKSGAYRYGDVIGLLIGHLKRAADLAVGDDVSHVVMGRPVHFVDNDSQADRSAEEALEAIARKQGFRHVEFQYEPIAAALDYEQTVDEEQYALIADIGGGTSDFSIVRVSPEGRRKADRSADVLANKGVHIGGVDFDRLLSMKAVMPHLGLNSDVRGPFGDKILAVPNGYYADLATWHRINLLYSRDVLRDLKDLERRSLAPVRMARLRAIIERRQGHSIAFGVENAKIALSGSETAAIDLGDVDPDLVIDVSRDSLRSSIGDRLAALRGACSDAVRQADIACDEIDVIFLTGGSSAIPAVRAAIAAIAPQAKVVEGDLFGSVGLGLGLDAARKFAGR